MIDYILTFYLFCNFLLLPLGYFLLSMSNFTSIVYIFNPFNGYPFDFFFFLSKGRDVVLLLFVLLFVSRLLLFVIVLYLILIGLFRSMV